MTTVHQAIGSVISELEGIGKNQRNKEQGYQFRGVDDVLKAVHPLLGKHGVFFCPDILEREYEERISAKGTVGHCAHLHVRYTVYGPDGDSVQLSTWGEGLDYGDKATNKAMTAAFKYALFELFAVSDPTEDGDSETPPESRTTKTNRRAQGTLRRAPAADRETGEIDPNLATPPQLGLIAKMMNDTGLADDRSIRHQYVEAVIGRSFESTKELTKREASLVIDELKKDAARDTPAETDDARYEGYDEEPFG